MRNFEIRANQFWYDGQPVLIQAGEFHYFRSPAEVWRDRLELLHKAGFNSVACYIPWLWHAVQPGEADLTGTSHPMRNLAGFLDLASEMDFFIIARPGPYIMAETINEGIPPWFFEQYPQAAMVDQHGQVQNIASYLHPHFLNCVRQWYRTVFAVLSPRQITRDGKIIMVQLDNEMGMPHWVRNMFDLNPDTLARFARFLALAYPNDLARRYPATDLTAFLKETLCDPASRYAVQVVADYRRFYRAYLKEYAGFLLHEARQNGMQVAPVVNIHGFANGGKTFPIGLSQLVEVMESEDFISATDVYPLSIGEGNFHQLVLVNEMTKALENPHQPLFSIEFQAGGNPDFGNTQSSFYDLHTRLCLSNEMRGINHYLFYDGENDPALGPVRRHDWGHPVRKDGSVRRHFARYAHLSAVLSAYGKDLLLSRSKTVACVAYLLDYFMTEVNHPLNRPLTDTLTHQRETILFDQIGRGLALTHRPFTALEISRAELEAGSTPHCWMMIEQQCPLAVQHKLIEYVRQGGQLVLIGRIPVEDFDQQPAGLLKETLGIQKIHTHQPQATHSIRAYGYSDVPVSYLETYQGDFDEVFAYSADGQAAGFMRTLGRGRLMMLGAALPANTLEDLDVFHQMALRLGCEPLFTLSDWADVRVSEGENGSFLFINNYQDDPIETVIQRGGQQLFGGNPLRVAARRGLILPLDWQLKRGLCLHYLTGEVTRRIERADEVTLYTEPAHFTAELSLSSDWQCDGARLLEQHDHHRRVQVSGEGQLTLRRTG